MNSQKGKGYAHIRSATHPPKRNRATYERLGNSNGNITVMYCGPIVWIQCLGNDVHRMSEDLSVSLGQIKQVAAVSFAIGTALVLGEIRIERLEIHKETYENIASAAKQKGIKNEKNLAVIDATLNTHITAQRQIALTNARLDW